MVKMKPENILIWIILTALLIGALIGALTTLGIVGVQAEEDVPTETFAALEQEVEDVKSKVEIPVAIAGTEKKTEPVEQEDKPELTDHYVGRCEITAYCTCVKCCGIWSQEHPSRKGTGYVQKTATGTVPTAGRTVAVDPSVIPLGSMVLINGVTYIAEDTGSAVKGNVVDVYFADHAEAVAFGRQTAEVSYIY